MQPNARKMRIRQQMRNAGQAFEKTHKWPGIQFVKCRAQRIRERFLAPAAELYFVARLTAAVPTDRVSGCGKHPRQLLRMLGLQEFIDDHMRIWQLCLICSGQFLTQPCDFFRIEYVGTSGYFSSFCANALTNRWDCRCVCGAWERSK